MLLDGSEGEGAALPAVLGAEPSFHLLKQCKSASLPPLHEHLSAPVITCCRLKLGFNGLLPLPAVGTCSGVGWSCLGFLGPLPVESEAAACLQCQESPQVGLVVLGRNLCCFGYKSADLANGSAAKCSCPAPASESPGTNVGGDIVSWEVCAGQHLQFCGFC